MEEYVCPVGKTIDYKEMNELYKFLLLNRKWWIENNDPESENFKRVIFRKTVALRLSVPSYLKELHMHLKNVSDLLLSYVSLR